MGRMWPSQLLLPSALFPCCEQRSPTHGVSDTDHVQALLWPSLLGPLYWTAGTPCYPEGAVTKQHTWALWDIWSIPKGLSLVSSKPYMEMFAPIFTTDHNDNSTHKMFGKLSVHNT